MYIYLHNKYTKWYYGIIQSAQNRRLDPGTYTERHHIIPRSLGGGDEASNLVALTLREHYICHLLLTKMCTGKAHHSMIHAAWCMARTRKGIRISSRTYEVLKEQAAQSMTPEELSARAKRGAKARNMTFEELSARSKKGAQSQTPEQRSARAKKGVQSQTPEQLSARSKKGWENTPPEERGARAKSAWEKVTPEERSNRNKKGWETRRLNVHAALNHSVTGTVQNLQ